VWEGGYKERVKEAECSRDIMYENGKMRPVETIPGMGEEGIRMSHRLEVLSYCGFLFSRL
jgi:hypothetical protein